MDRLGSGEKIIRGMQLTSNDGNFSLKLQEDGNLVLYRGTGRRRKPLWDSGTSGQPSEVLMMQPDGRLVILGPGERVVWEPDRSQPTARRVPGSWLELENDGSLRIYYGKIIGMYDRNPDNTYTISEKPPEGMISNIIQFLLELPFVLLTGG
jgi:hypothetical protein